jgi:serine/threonine protein kinase
MYILFTEKLPFPVDNLQQLYYCHLNLLPEHPTTVNPKCPLALGDLIMKLLTKNPKPDFEIVTNCVLL